MHQRMPKPITRASVPEPTLRSQGRPIESATRRLMESRFQHDFSRVRVHHSAEAVATARDAGALAYTAGDHIVFAAGQYAPATVEGRELLVHELTHVVQQRGAPAQPAAVRHFSAPTDAAEVEARAIAHDFDVMPPRPMLRATPGSVQRQVCEARPAEEQVCRAEPEVNQSIAAPETDPVDIEFWTLAPRIPADAEPVFDPQSNAVIAFRTRGSVSTVCDLTGRVVEMDEPGLESPLIDPIDLLAGGLTGLARGLGRSGVRAAARGGAGVLASGGVRAAARVLSARAFTAVRTAFRALRARGALNFTATTATHMADPARRVPMHILRLAQLYGARTLDPQRAAGAFRYTIAMIRNGSEYTLEVVIREPDQLVLHFEYFR